jgi:hypothetical protein
MSQRRSSLVPGLILIALGLILLANRLDWAHPRWYHIYPLILVAFGIGSAYSIRGRGHSDGVFQTVFFLSLGIFFVLRNYDILPRYLYIDEFWPIFLIAPGLAMIAVFLFVPDEWRMLIPGGALAAFGGLLMADELGYVQIYRLADYWPVILIAVGLSIFFKGFRQAKA